MASLKANPFEKADALVDFDAPDGWVPVAAYQDRSHAQYAGLAVLAMGDAYWMMPHAESLVICVAENRKAAIRAELEAVERLQRNVRPGGRVNLREFHLGVGSFVLYAVILIGFFAAQSRFDLQTLGRIDAEAMLAGGEWWRAVTALCLHSDVVHLAANLVAGAGFAFLVARFFGASAGWLLILLSGALGNALNAWVHYPEAHYAIGASTAVFAALGLVTGVGVKLGLLDPQLEWSQSRWLLPALGGLTLLGMLGLGSGDGTVDVAAHFSGFASGVLVGFAGSFYQPLFFKLDRWRRGVAAGALGLIALAWLLAMR